MSKKIVETIEPGCTIVLVVQSADENAYHRSFKVKPTQGHTTGQRTTWEVSFWRHNRSIMLTSDYVKSVRRQDNLTMYLTPIANIFLIVAFLIILITSFVLAN